MQIELDRALIEYVLSNWGAAYSMLPPTRNADRAKVVEDCLQALAKFPAQPTKQTP